MNKNIHRTKRNPPRKQYIWVSIYVHGFWEQYRSKHAGDNCDQVRPFFALRLLSSFTLQVQRPCSRALPSLLPPLVTCEPASQGTYCGWCHFHQASSNLDFQPGLKYPNNVCQNHLLKRFFKWQKNIFSIFSQYFLRNREKIPRQRHNNFWYPANALALGANFCPTLEQKKILGPGVVAMLRYVE